MKVYIVTKGEYSDYHICAVTTDKDTAEKLAEKYADSYDDTWVEEFDTDHAEMSLAKKKIFFCSFDPDNSEIEVDDKGDRGSWEGIRPSHFVVSGNSKYMYVYINADTKEEAIKIASDKFAKYRAEKMDL